MADAWKVDSQSTPMALAMATKPKHRTHWRQVFSPYSIHEEEKSRYIERVNGKRHHSFRDQVPYPLNYERSTLELDHLDHAYFLGITGGSSTMVHYPKGKAPTSYLDLGCGSGGWILQAAKQWPNCHFVGFDIVDVQTGLSRTEPSIAKRVKWVHGNFLEKFPFKDGQFDHVALRFIAKGVPEESWPTLLQEIARVLRVGGALEIIDEDIIFPVLPRCYTASSQTRHLNPLMMNRVPPRNSAQPSSAPSLINQAYAFGRTQAPPPSPKKNSGKNASSQTQGLYATVSRGLSDTETQSIRLPGISAHHHRSLTTSTSRTLIGDTPEPLSFIGFRSSSITGPSGNYSNSTPSISSRALSLGKMAKSSSSTRSSASPTAIHNNLALQKPKQRMAKPQPHDHFVLERLYSGVFERRSINMKPTSLLHDFLSAHFKQVISTPIISHPLPPPPKDCPFYESDRSKHSTWSPCSELFELDKLFKQQHSGPSRSEGAEFLSKPRSTSFSSSDSRFTPSLFAASSDSSSLSNGKPSAHQSSLSTVASSNFSNSGRYHVTPLSSASLLSPQHAPDHMTRTGGIPSSNQRKRNLSSSRPNIPSAGTLEFPRSVMKDGSSSSGSAPKDDRPDVHYHGLCQELERFMNRINTDVDTLFSPSSKKSDRRTTIHFLKSWENVLACREPMYEELIRSQQENRTEETILDELWWDDFDVTKSTREKFDILMDRFETDMRTRTSLSDAMESGLSWVAPTKSRTKAEEAWEEDLIKERVEARRLEEESAKRKAEIEGCEPDNFMISEGVARTIQIFVATRGADISD